MDNLENGHGRELLNGQALNAIDGAKLVSVPFQPEWYCTSVRGPPGSIRVSREWQ